MRVEFHGDAIDELEQSVAWYAERSTSAAASFAASVDDAMEKIVSDPARFPKAGKQHRACNLIDFPFQIVYRFDATRLQVVAVAHAKRRAGYWKNRK